ARGGGRGKDQKGVQPALGGRAKGNRPAASRDGAVSERIEDRLKAKARDLGFELAGIARAGEADGFDRFRDRVDRGYAGEMAYLRRHADPRRHPESILDDVRSVLMLGMTYAGELASISPLSAAEGANQTNKCQPARIAKYALGPDYHRYLWDKLNPLSAW